METFVSKELALKLNDKGFNEECNHEYIINGDDIIRRLPNYFQFNKGDKLVSAPTLSQTQDWFRNKGIIISVNYVKNGLYECKLFWIDSMGHEQHTILEEKPYVWSFDDYNHALEFGIDNALKFI